MPRWCGRTSTRPGRGRQPPADVDPARLAPAALSPRCAQGAEASYGPGGAGPVAGGLTSKIHLLADSGCRPLARVTSAGQRHDSLAFVPLMDRLKVARRGPGGPGPGPGGSWAIRRTPAPRSALTCAAGSRPPSPSPRTRPATGCGAAAGAAARPPSTPAAYKQRNVVERAFCQLRQHRAVATRYDKRDFVWRGTVDVASIRIWLRHPVS